MGLCNSRNIFQEKMSEIFVGLDTIHVYINDLLYVKKVSWAEHITVLKEKILFPEGWAQGQLRQVMLCRPQI